MAEIAKRPGTIRKCRQAMLALEVALTAADDLYTLQMKGYVQNSTKHFLTAQIANNAMMLFKIFIENIGGNIISGEGLDVPMNKSILAITGDNIISKDGFQIKFKDESILQVSFSEDFFKKWVDDDECEGGENE